MKELILKFLEMIKEFMPKLLSGRYYLTLVCGAVFAYATYTKLLEAQAVSAILTMVFMNYFQRDRTQNGTPK